MCYLGHYFSFSGLLHASDMTGIWKTIDDQTGYSRGDVTVVKNADGTYSGTLTAIRPLPYKPLVGSMLKMQRQDLKMLTLVGLEIIKGFKSGPKHPIEYSNGTVLDPLSGNVYKGKAKLIAKANV